MPGKRESKVTIKIPRPLYRRLQAIIDGTGFDSVTDFVVYVLRDIAAAKGLEQGSEPESADSGRLTAKEIEKVRQRLRSLGYF